MMQEKKHSKGKRKREDAGETMPVTKNHVKIWSDLQKQGYVRLEKLFDVKKVSLPVVTFPETNPAAQTFHTVDGVSAEKQDLKATGASEFVARFLEQTNLVEKLKKILGKETTTVLTDYAWIRRKPKGASSIEHADLYFFRRDGFFNKHKSLQPHYSRSKYNVMACSFCSEAKGESDDYCDVCINRDMPLYTVWLPLKDVGPDDSTLQILEGSHFMHGWNTRNKKEELPKDFKSQKTAYRWVTAKGIQFGDAIIFNCKTIHAATTQNSGTRLSLDIRLFARNQSQPDINTEIQHCLEQIQRVFLSSAASFWYSQSVNIIFLTGVIERLLPAKENHQITKALFANWVESKKSASNLPLLAHVVKCPEITEGPECKSESQAILDAWQALISSPKPPTLPKLTDLFTLAYLCGVSSDEILAYAVKLCETNLEKKATSNIPSLYCLTHVVFCGSGWGLHRFIQPALAKIVKQTLKHYIRNWDYRNIEIVCELATCHILLEGRISKRLIKPILTALLEFPGNYMRFIPSKHLNDYTDYHTHFTIGFFYAVYHQYKSESH